jgi:hypothetical protein
LYAAGLLLLLLLLLIASSERKKLAILEDVRRSSIEVVAVEKSRLKSDDPLARVVKFELGSLGYMSPSTATKRACDKELQKCGVAVVEKGEEAHSEQG